MAENILSNKELAIIYFSAQGKASGEIAELIGSSPAYVNKTLNEERVQFEIRLMRHKLFGKDVQKRFKELLPAALDKVEEILQNPNTKPGLGFAAAQEIFDRSMGKPKQTVEVHQSLLKNIFEKLDQAPPPIDITPSADIARIEKSVVEVQSQKCQEPVDLVDAWAKENL